MRTILALFVGALLAAAVPSNPVIEQVRAYYNIGNGLQCSATVEIDVPGMTIPNKYVFIEMRPDKKPKIKGSGLVFLPKKGLSNQFDELLGQDAHIIEMGPKGDTSVFKLVAIDPKSDWVTADLYIMTNKSRIEKMVIQSRENGEYMINHTYKEAKFPAKSVISFQTEQFKLPLQMMNRAKKTEEELEGPVTGIITLTYSDYIFLD